MIGAYPKSGTVYWVILVARFKPCKGFRDRLLGIHCPEESQGVKRLVGSGSREAFKEPSQGMTGRLAQGDVLSKKQFHVSVGKEPWNRNRGLLPECAAKTIAKAIRHGLTSIPRVTRGQSSLTRPTLIAHQRK